MNGAAFYGDTSGLAFLLGISMVVADRRRRHAGGDLVAQFQYSWPRGERDGKFAIGNNVLIIAGALEGAGGFILSLIMSKAMNRSFANIIFGAFGAAPSASNALKLARAEEPKSTSPEDAAVQLAYASSVVIIPGVTAWRSPRRSTSAAS